MGLVPGRRPAELTQCSMWIYTRDLGATGSSLKDCE